MSILISSWIKNAFQNNANNIKVQIYLYCVDDNNPSKFDISISKHRKVKDIRQKLPTKFHQQSIYWWINYKFRDQSETIEELIKDYKETKDYIFMAIIITDDDKDRIDYDIDLKMSTRFAEIIAEASTDPEINQIFDCERCYQEYCAIEMCICKHKCCKKCLKKSVDSYKFKCPIYDCDKHFTDYDLQKSFAKEYIAIEEKLMKLDYVTLKVGWPCSCCTYFNDAESILCVVCYTKRNFNYRIPRYYILKETVKKTIEPKDMDIIYNKDVVSCLVCFDDAQPNKAIILHGCQHSVCIECCEAYLLNCNMAKVPCPSDECESIIEDREIRKVLSPSDYHKYQSLCLRFIKDPNVYQCRYVNCNYIIIRGDEYLKYFKCGKCGKGNCIPCETIHENISCEVYQKLKRENQSKADLENEIYIQSLIDTGEAMRCPGCSILIQKSKGCDGVECKSCHTMMCWATKGPRWGPGGKGDTSGGCGCQYYFGKKCHPSCKYCH